MENICIIGGGNLGQAIAEGMLESGIINPHSLFITRRNTEALEHYKEKGVHVTTDNSIAIEHCKYIILAVKPYQIKYILENLSDILITGHHVIVSVITGISLDELASWSSSELTIFRAMPNTAIAVRASMTCICGRNYTETEQSTILHIFETVGKCIFIEESLMDAATVLGACGTAYAMRFIRANIQGGIEIGFSAETAALIAAQTAMGASKILLEKHTHPEQEIDKVTTPKGCTIAGLNEMEHQGFSSSLIKGIASSYNKIKQDM